VNVLTRTLRHLTVEECGEVAGFAQDCIEIEAFKRACYEDLEPSKMPNKVADPADQPAIIQEWFIEWLRDDHYPLSPVDKDHAEDLWLKFCEEVGR